MPKKTAAQLNPLAKHTGLPKDERFRKAIEWVEQGHAIATTARQLNVSRSQLNVRLNEHRADKADAAARSQLWQDMKVGADGTKAIVTVSVSNEKRRVPPFNEFNELYFNGLICPDCGIHHVTPSFHNEIVDAVYGPSLRVLINVPPYHSKSTLVTAKTTIHSLVENPNGRHIIVSASQSFARTFMHQIQSWFKNPELYANSARNLIEDWGPFEGTSGWTATQLYVAGRSSSEKDPSILAMGVGNQIYGRRADRIIFDDIATLDNMRNPEQVTKTMEWIDKEALSRIGKTGKAIFVGTRISSGDIYAHLQRRETYNVVKYPCVLDEDSKLTLWEEHFPYEMAVIRRSEMRPEDWQLVYQNVDTPGAGSSFPPEVLETCLDTTMVHGQVNPAWKLVIGLDPAGGGKQSGYTAMVLLGLDGENQHIHVVDTVNVRGMKAFQMKDQLLDWCNTYPIRELRTEVNGIQGQLIQYNQDLVVPLTQKGVRIVPHYTTGNKWDANFGVESIAPWFYNQKISIPWGSTATQHKMREMMDQFIGFPMAERSDLVMAFWFAYLACKEGLALQPGPMYGHRHVPQYVRNRRKVGDPQTGALWRPTDPNMPDFGRTDYQTPRYERKLVNVGGSISF